MLDNTIPIILQAIAMICGMALIFIIVEAEMNEGKNNYGKSFVGFSL